jgi:hypothetical protein
MTIGSYRHALGGKEERKYVVILFIWISRCLGVILCTYICMLCVCGDNVCC